MPRFRSFVVKKGSKIRAVVSGSLTLLERVAGIDHEIQQDMFELAGIGADQGQIVRQAVADLDALRREAAEHRFDALHDVIQIEQFGLENLAAAESEQLAGQQRRPVAGLLDGGESRLGGGAGGGETAQLGIAIDDGQQIVEIVGDSAGQFADRLHLLRLPQLLLQLNALGDIAGGR